MSPEVIEAVRPAATSAEHTLASRRKTSQSTTWSPARDRPPPSGPSDPSIRRAQDHHPLEVRQPLAVGHGLLEELRVVGAEEALDGEEEPGPRRPQDVGGLGPPVAGVEGNEQSTGTHGARARPRPTRRSWVPRWPPGRPARSRWPRGTGWPPPPRSASSSKVRRVTRPPGPAASTSASASPKRAAASSTSPGMEPHCRSPRGSVTSDTASG